LIGLIVVGSVVGLVAPGGLAPSSKPLLSVSYASPPIRRERWCVRLSEAGEVEAETLAEAERGLRIELRTLQLFPDTNLKEARARTKPLLEWPGVSADLKEDVKGALQTVAAKTRLKKEAAERAQVEANAQRIVNTVEAIVSLFTSDVPTAADNRKKKAEPRAEKAAVNASAAIDAKAAEAAAADVAAAEAAAVEAIAVAEPVFKRRWWRRRRWILFGKRLE